MIPTELSTVKDGWRDVNVNAEYVPKFGQVLHLGLVFEPLPPTKNDRGRIVAVNFECGRGKSFVFREYMKKILEENPKVLMLRAIVRERAIPAASRGHACCHN